uniref:BTB domain-containing protein n=1 Tax=Parastrongyloides trichosuri TaxID=131310 RepID=A0A0N4ZQY7_PARTI
MKDKIILDSINLNGCPQSCKDITIDKDEWEEKYQKHLKLLERREGELVITFDALRFPYHSCYPIINMKGLPFEIMAETNCSPETDNKRCLSVYIACDRKSKSHLWTCNANVEIKIRNLKFKDMDIVKSFCHNYKYNSNRMGFIDFIEWNTLTDRNYGYINDVEFVIEATIKINEISGVVKKVVPDFTKSENLPSEAKFIIDGIDIYANKDYLSLYSPVFKKMFNSNFAESNMKEIPLNQICIGDFIELLEVIYPCHKGITEESVESLLILGDMFDISYVMEKCEQFLVSTDQVKLETKLFWSDKYVLKELYDICLSKLRNGYDIIHLKESLEYAELSDAAKISIFDKASEFL